MSGFNFDLASGLSSLAGLSDKFQKAAGSALHDLESTLTDDRFGLGRSQPASGAATPRAAGAHVDASTLQRDLGIFARSSAD
jgi:hypothetical protein